MDDDDKFSESEAQESRPYLPLEQVIEHVLTGTVEMIRTRRVSGRGAQSHPQEITPAEIETLKKILAKLIAVSQRIERDSSLPDVPLGDVFTSDDTVRVFRNWGIKSVMEIRQFEPARLPSVFTHCLALGGPLGKHQLHMYLFADDHE
jgi:hypothetical protein